MNRTVRLALLAALLGGVTAFTGGFMLRFLFVAYRHGGFM